VYNLYVCKLIILKEVNYSIYRKSLYLIVIKIIYLRFLRIIRNHQKTKFEKKIVLLCLYNYKLTSFFLLFRMTIDKHTSYSETEYIF